MIITNIKTTLLSLPYEDPPKIGFIDIGNIDLLIVEIETSSGLVGMGYLHFYGFITFCNKFFSFFYHAIMT